MRRSHKRELSSVTVGAIVLAVVLLGTYLGFRKEIPFRSHHELKVVVANANGLRPNAPVRIAGVNIGKVKKVEKADAGASAATLTLRLDKTGLPIHSDARVSIRPRIFLEGNFFVDINPGSPSAPELGDGDTIPINQTRTPVQLDQVLTTLQSSVRQDLRGLLTELDRGLGGEGAAGYRRSIPYWKDAYRDSAIVNEATLGTAEHDLSGYIAKAGAVAEALDRQPAKLQSFITDLDTTANAFAVRSSALSAAIDELPRTLAAGTPALQALGRALPPLRAFADDLRPGVRSTGPAIDAALPFVRQLRALVGRPELRGLVDDLTPAVPSLARLSRRSVPLFKNVRAASSCQNRVILPWSQDTIVDKSFPATGPVYQDSLKVLPGLAGESRTGDANGQWFRVLVNGGTYSTPLGNGRIMLSSEPVSGVNPPNQARSPLRSDVPCETQQAPDLRTVPQTMTSRRSVVPATKLAQQLTAKNKAVGWLRRQLKATGDTRFTVSSVPATLDTVADVLAQRKAAVAKALQGKGARK